jgi:hypothetical protein
MTAAVPSTLPRVTASFSLGLSRSPKDPLPQVLDTPIDSLPINGMPVEEVTRSYVCSMLHRTFPSGCNPFALSFGSMVRRTSAPFRGTPSGAIRRVMASPCLSACRPSLLAPSCTRCGVGPLLRWGYWRIPDRNGVATFRIGKMRWASWPLYAGSGAPPQPTR